MPEDVMSRLIAGVTKFQREVYPGYRELFQKLAMKQNPRILFLTCADSRVNPNLITQTEPGELFICRNIGNLIPPHGTQDGGVATVMEYAVEVLGVEHIIVCGHSSCGAMKSLLDPSEDLDVPQVRAWLRFAEAARRVATALHERQSQEDLLRVLTEQNVIAQLTNLRTYPEIAARLATNRLNLHGWYYDIASGSIAALDESSAEFKPLMSTGTQATDA